MEKKLRNIKIIFLFIILIIILFLSRDLIFLPKVKYQIQESIQNKDNGLDYIIISEYESKGAFVANQEIKARIKIISLLGRDFTNLNSAEIFIGEIGDPIYKYPEEYSEEVRRGTKIEFETINILNDDEALSGEKNVEYSLPGEYGLYTIHLKYKDGTEYSWISKRKILIEPTSVLLQIKSYRLTLITLLLTIILFLIGRWWFEDK